MAASRKPQAIDNHNWYYEHPTHILLVHEVRDSNGLYIRTDSVKIPWRKIEVSMERARHKNARGRKRRLTQSSR